MGVSHNITLVTAIVTDSITVAPLISAIFAPPQLLLLLIRACARRLTCPVLAWLVVTATAGGPGVVVGGEARYRVTTGHCRQTQLLVVRYNG